MNGLRESIFSADFVVPISRKKIRFHRFVRKNLRFNHFSRHFNFRVCASKPQFRRSSIYENTGDYAYYQLQDIVRVRL